MARKNIFLIGRKGHRGDEDQLTEMLAFLWQEDNEALRRWLDCVGVQSLDPLLQTQYVIPSGKRPDVAIFGVEETVLIESKLGALLGETQPYDYIDYLAEKSGIGHLVLLTQNLTGIGAFEQYGAERGVRVLGMRWQDISELLAAPGDESLAGDFVEMLFDEGLVKPPPFGADEWAAWHRGYELSLRVDALLAEAAHHIRQRFPQIADQTQGQTKRWLYRLWKIPELGLQAGLGLASGYSDSGPQGVPIIFAKAFNHAKSKSDAKAAIGGVNWKEVTEPVRGIVPPIGGYGLQWGEWPTRVRDADLILTSSDFTQQVEQAVDFFVETFQFFVDVGYVPQLTPEVPAA